MKKINLLLTKKVCHPKIRMTQQKKKRNMILRLSVGFLTENYKKQNQSSREYQKSLEHAKTAYRQDCVNSQKKICGRLFTRLRQVVS